MSTNSDTSKISIAVDVLGGDAAPAAVLAGVKEVLLNTHNIQIVLTGPAQFVEPVAQLNPDRVRAVPTTQAIGMDEHPAEAVHAKKDSSIVVGCRLVKEGQAQGFFSAGSTGACLAAATLVIGRIKGVMRPAIATILPAPTGGVVLLDSGANADVKPEMLLQFAHMGTVYARQVLGVNQPRVGLLNIGSEATKGSLLAQESYTLLANQLDSFSGNIEGTHLLAGTHDVVVTDGFTGNVVLKTVEGTAATLLKQIKTVFTSSAKSKLAAALLQKDMRALKDNLSAEKVGGAPLLGCKGVVVIGHGTSNATAIANGIKATARIITAQVPELIAKSLSDSQQAQSKPLTLES